MSLVLEILISSCFVITCGNIAKSFSYVLIGISLLSNGSSNLLNIYSDFSNDEPHIQTLQKIDKNHFRHMEQNVGHQNSYSMIFC